MIHRAIILFVFLGVGSAGSSCPHSLLLAQESGLSGTSPVSAAGQWWQYRADRRLSGRCEVAGDIAQPAIRWSYPIAGRHTEDFIRYASVIARRDGQLKRLWLDVWEPKIKDNEFPTPEESVVVRINPEPVQDVDGDARKEIVVSVFNHSRDLRWHVLALDALTGAVKTDLAGQFLTGLRDVNGDGVAELFCTAVVRGPRIPAPAELTLIALRGGAPQAIWRLANSSFATHEIGQFPATVNSGAARGAETVLCTPGVGTKSSIFFTRNELNAADGDVEVTAWRTTGQQVESVAAWTGPRLQPLAIRTDAAGVVGVLLQAASFDREPARVQCSGGRASAAVLVSRRAPAATSPVVVGRPLPMAPPLAIVQGANETVEAIRLTPNGQATRAWMIPGRGMTCNNYLEGVLLADLTGDGRLATVVGTRGPGDCARLHAVSATDGATLWTHDFEDYPGTPPPWNVPGLMYWQGGYYRDRSRMDLLVQTRRIGGESCLLDGRTGEPVWQRTQGRRSRDFGRTWMAMYDFDGDQLEDVLNIYPDMFCVARGTDGSLFVAEESHKYVDIYAYYADMIAADFLRRDRPQVLYSHEFVTCLLTGQGQRIWKIDHPHPGGWRNMVGWGDADGDGQMELFFPGAVGQQGREFQCRDAASGDLQWRLSLPDEPPTWPAVADVNGDGRDECVFTMGRALYAVGIAAHGDATTPTGSVLWRLDLPSTAGPVAIADMQGTGKVQIVVTCADGFVYGIGGQ